MKYFAGMLAVFALVVPVMAQEPVTITATINGQYLTLGYNATGATKPAAFSFIVDCGAGQVASLNDVGLADSFFDVCIDYAADDPAAYQAGADPATGVLAGAHPLAKTDQAGAVVFPARVFSISAAELANIDTIPTAGTICTLKITGTGTVCFSEDALRGGVVDTNGNAMEVTLPDCISITLHPCDCLGIGQVFSYSGPGPAVTLTVTQAMMDRAEMLGCPICWCCLAQKAGNGVATNTRVDTGDLNCVKRSWNKTCTSSGYEPCCDFNMSCRVDTGDLNILKSHWNKITGGC